jgi:uncharacterized protein (TIGR03437 family)
MKYISVLLLTAAVAAGADFTTGQAARLVIGQPGFTKQEPQSTDSVLGAASGVAYANDTLFVADSNRVGATPSNHRLLLFQNLSSQLPKPTDVIPENGSSCPVCLGKATIVLGQPDFTTTTESIAATRSSLRLPTGVASDGVHLIVADTNHNRVLVWNQIPSTNNAPADVVIGQPDFTSIGIPPGGFPTATSLRGPEGVWVQNGKLYIADTQNNRVLIYNRIPTSNGAAADLVLGQPNFTTFVQIDLTKQDSSATASNMMSPVAVSTDGQRLFVTDLGYNRILVWNSIPTANGAAASLAIGQPDLTSSAANNAYTVDTDNDDKQTAVLCTVSDGVDDNDNLTYPALCNATLNFPRFVLPAANRLFVADSGNDRILVFNAIPTSSGASADLIIGQIGGTVNQASDAADSLRTPMSMAWDGTNLYVSDAFNRRITVYSMGETSIPYSGVRNGASFEIRATGSITVGGDIQSGDIATITIDDEDYTYTVTASDTLETVLDALVDVLNSSNDDAGDPNVDATADVTTVAGTDYYILRLRAKVTDIGGNDISYSVKVSTSAKLSLTAAGSYLSGGGDAAKVAPGTLVTIWARLDQDAVMTYNTAQADLSKNELPRQLGETTVYINGIAAPLLYVSPKQINAQVPWEVYDSTSINAYVRAVKPDGTVVVTTPVAISIVTGNPGIFTYGGSEGFPVMLHGSSHATGIVSVDGSAIAGASATINIGNRTYTYTIAENDTLNMVRDALIVLINSSDPVVTAIPSSVFTRILLQAKVEGPDGNGIPYSAENSGDVVITAFSESLCCANVGGSLVSDANPAQAGETVTIYATGLGLPEDTGTYNSYYQTGVKFAADTPATAPLDFVSSLAGGSTADVLGARPMPGMFGVYEVTLHLNSAIETDTATKMYIAQDVYESNQVTFPVVNVTSPAQ